MKEAIKVISIVTVVFAAVIAIGAALNSDNGIIGLEGYEHGVAFCENEYSAVIHLEEASVWNDGVATYVINEGHYKDPEVKDLVALAKVECAKYDE